MNTQFMVYGIQPSLPLRKKCRIIRNKSLSDFYLRSV